MTSIKCPACGEVNPAELEFCRNCQARLQQSETGDLRKAGGPIQPGQAPTKKATAELEPILPQWLRDARNEAREGAKAEAEQIAKNLQQPALHAHQTPDLLAGLQSQADDEDDETPDWLATITGAPPKPKKNGMDEKDMRRVEFDNEDNKPAPPHVSAATNRITATQAPSEATPDSPLPPWLAGMDSSQPATGGDELGDLFSRSAPKQGENQGTDQVGLPEAGLSAGDALFQSQRKPSEPESSDWLKNLQAEQSASAPVETQDETPFVTDLPDWLKGSEGSAPVNVDSPTSASVSETPDWIKSLDAGTPAIPTESAAPLASDDLDWMKDLKTEQAQPAQAASADTPDWLKGFASETESVAPAPSADTPDWLKGFASETEAAVPVPSADSPDWLKNVGQEKPAPEEPKPAFSGDVPDWLKSVGQNDSASEPVAPDFFGQSVADEPPAPAAPVKAQAESQNDSSPFFADQGLSGEDVNSLFTQMPDWMSNTPADSKSAQGAPPAAQSADAISSAALPSWVQAMRPVESSFSQTPAQGIGTDQTLETHGPLSGLQGVLPSMPFTPTSKPKAYSIKVQASQEQQTQAALLEHIVEMETKPEPISSVPVVTSARGLRWVITALLLLITAGSLYVGTKIFAMPLGEPKELTPAIEAVGKVPGNAPVLVIFDYDPATVGEMEAVAAPLLDYMILQHHPRLTFVSTSPTGAALAERFISGPLGEQQYQSGIQYVNLGYLPGGLVGIRAFAQDPRTTMPMSTDLNPAWQSAPLQDVQSLSNFALILLITDSAEVGRNWVEQVDTLHGNAPFVVASSAQAGPMIMPYVQSGQVNGLVNGLNSGAVIEQGYASRQNTARRYWDAYSLGLFLAVAFILFGGFWNLVLGFRARALAAKGDE